MSYSHKKGLSLLIEYAKNQGFKSVNLEFDGVSTVYWSYNEPNFINIEGNHSIENKVYILLHELGHHELRKNWGYFTKENPIVAEAEMSCGSKLKRRIGYYVSCLEEEYKAWSRGYELGKSLGININDKKWFELKNKCIMGYIRFFGKK